MNKEQILKRIKDTEWSIKYHTLKVIEHEGDLEILKEMLKKVN